jgi:hypothetical protein
MPLAVSGGMKNRLICKIMFLVLPGSACLLIAACQPRPTLEPTAEALSAEMGRDAAKATGHGVTLRVEGSAWPGDSQVKEEVTPLKIQIQNDSAHPLRLRYETFVLVSEKGQHFAALPPFEIEGSIQEPRAVSYSRRPYHTSFFYNRFYAAPQYRNIYPSLSPYPYVYNHDSAHYSTHYDYWKDIELPTERMQEVALPEGVIDPGGSVRGHLYFEKVSAELERVHLKVNLTNEVSGQSFATLEVPLRVE